MNAKILSYSRNKGLFAGVSLGGSTLRSDGSANEKLYRKKLSAKDIIREGRVGIPPCARELVSLLNTKSSVNSPTRNRWSRIGAFGSGRGLLRHRLFTSAPKTLQFYFPKGWEQRDRASLSDFGAAHWITA